MTVLAEKQFEILPSADATNGFVFGIGADVSLDDNGFDPGDAEWVTQDGQNTRRGVIGFGRDVRGAKSWTWESHVDQDDVESAVDVLERFATAWSPELLVRDPGAVTALRYRLAGRDRRVFGRPRRFAAPPSNLIDVGYVPVTHDFQLVDSYTYADVESSAEIPYSSGAGGGGFAFPLTFPLQTQTSEGTGAQQISIGGSMRAYPTIRFNGPWTNPVIRTGDWDLAWKGSIPASGWVEVDCRPWALTVLNQDGASVVGGLDRTTWLEDCWFAPGSMPFITLAGIASTGSASATVRWRDTFTSI